MATRRQIETQVHACRVKKCNLCRKFRQKALRLIRSPRLKCTFSYQRERKQWGKEFRRAQFFRNIVAAVVVVCYCRCCCCVTAAFAALLLLLLLYSCTRNEREREREREAEREREEREREEREERERSSQNAQTMLAQRVVTRHSNTEFVHNFRQIGLLRKLSSLVARPPTVQIAYHPNWNSLFKKALKGSNFEHSTFLLG